jgi:hypothetical protein
MLRSTHYLHFPKFVYVGRVDMKQWKDTDKVADCYELDWSAKEDRAQRRFDDLVGIQRDGNIKFVPDFPEEYNEWLTGLRFVISRAYMEEIRRNAQKSLEEWNIQRPFDTICREMCLRPAIQHAYTAFYLTADCTYDESENFYYRGPRKSLVTHALAYKFWVYQTGINVVKYNAEIERLSKLISWKTMGNEEREEIERFLLAIEDHSGRIRELGENASNQGRG